MLRPPYDPEDMPTGIARLPLDGRGYPIPWFVDRDAPLKDGNPDFRIMDGKHLKLAIRERRCWICGGRITTHATFVAGPMCGVNRTSAEPPNHFACAQWAVKACPFLAIPKRLRDERAMPVNATQAGIGIKRNPGVAMLWMSSTWKTWRPDAGQGVGPGVLFDLGDPLAVEWWCEGRAATRAEVMHSTETGLPFLLAEAVKGGPEHIFALGRMTERFLAYLPEEETHE